MTDQTISNLVTETLSLALRFAGIDIKDDAEVQQAERCFRELLVAYGFKKPQELRDRLAALLPGLLTFKAEKGRDKDGLFRFTPNLKVGSFAATFAAIATHTLKLSNPYASGQVPVDVVTQFEGSGSFVGAHTVPLDARYDCSASASFAQYLRQVRHLLANSCRYALPDELPLNSLPEPVLAHIAAIEAIVGQQKEGVNRPAAVHFGVPQVLLPDSISESGYISVTPATCGGVITQLSERINERKERIKAIEKANEKLLRSKAKTGRKRALDEIDGEPTEPQPVPGAVPHTRQYMKAVSKMMNLSQIVRAGSAILIARPPVDDADKRDALHLVRDLPGWVAKTLRRHQFRKDQVGRELKSFVTLFARMDEATATNARERLRLMQYARFFSVVLVNRFSSVVSDHGNIVDASAPSDEQLAAAIAQQLNVILKFSAAPDLVAEWAAEALDIIRNRKESRHVAHA